jgi:hypothetical protein
VDNEKMLNLCNTEESNGRKTVTTICMVITTAIVIFSVVIAWANVRFVSEENKLSIIKLEKRQDILSEKQQEQYNEILKKLSSLDVSVMELKTILRKK